MDYSKRTQKEIEEIGARGGRDATALKKAGFEHRIDRVEEAIKNATSEARSQQLKKVRDQSLKIYNKYNNSNFKG